LLVLDMIEILPPLGKYKYDTWRILLVKCYIDNCVHLRCCIRNVNRPLQVPRWLGGQGLVAAVGPMVVVTLGVGVQAGAVEAEVPTCRLRQWRAGWWLAGMGDQLW
jgi:hypothetical protein